METKVINKVAILKLKESIKNAAERQKWFKNQRKTVNKDCSRKSGDMKDISPSEAAWKHRINRDILHTMYMAYAVMRDKSMVEAGLKQFDEEWQKEEFIQSVDRMINIYEKEAEKEEKDA